MKKIRRVVVLLAVIAMMCPSMAQAKTFRKWRDVLLSRGTVNVYVETVANDTGDAKVSEEKETDIVKKMFQGRITPKFKVVSSKADADIVFQGDVKEYVWMEKAPITAIYGAGALVVDLATRGNKNYARKLIKYRICTPEKDKEILKGVTLVTLKQAGMPEEESYAMMRLRGGKMLSKDIFRKGKRKTLRP